MTGAVSVLVAEADWQLALAEARRQLGAVRADLVVLCVDDRLRDGYQEIVRQLHTQLAPRVLLGCSGAGVIGRGVESEAVPAISVLAVEAPDAVLQAVTYPAGRSFAAAPALDDPALAGLLVLAHPFTTDGEALIAALHGQRPELPLLGGFASSHGGQAGTVLFAGDGVLDGGAVVVGIGGSLRLRGLVAQGAEPIGQSWTITDAERNVIRSLGNRPALEVLQEALASLEPVVRERAMRNLLAGVAMDEYRDAYGRGDFLVRNLMGVDPESGAVAVNELVRPGQTFQFQFRDAGAADDDLQAHLAALPGTLDAGEVPLGAVLCACNGRGSGLFGTPDHDAAALEASLGPLAVTGLFCNGEIGPVGRRPYLHGFTASIAILTTRA